MFVEIFKRAHYILLQFLVSGSSATSIGREKTSDTEKK
jgi:hypothetical protein